MYKNVIWDFDGTLFDTYPMIARCLCHAVGEMGFTVTYEEAYTLAKQSIGHAERTFAQRFGLDAKELSARREQAYGDVDPAQVGMFPHVREILEEIAARNERSFIFTHRGESTRLYISAHGIEHLFTDIVPGKRGFARKPDPAGNLYIIEKYGLIREETIAVGDREIDILAGKNAGVDSCLFVEKDTNVTTAATYAIKSFDQLRDILFK